MSGLHYSFNNVRSAWVTARAFSASSHYSGLDKSTDISERDTYIVNRFLEDFAKELPQVTTIKDVLLWCNRSLRLQRWLAQIKADWALKSEMPEWLKGQIPEQEYTKVRKLVQSVNEWKEMEGNQIKEEAEKFKSACSKIRKDCAEKMAVPLENNIVFIHNLTTQHLPFSLLAKVITISEDSETPEEEQNKLIKDIMVTWKRALLKEHLDGSFDRRKYLFT